MQCNTRSRMSAFYPLHLIIYKSAKMKSNARGESEKQHKSYYVLTTYQVLEMDLISG